MKKITINITDKQNEDLDRISEDMGVTKNGIICIALDDWLYLRKLRERDAQR